MVLCWGCCLRRIFFLLCYVVIAHAIINYIFSLHFQFTNVESILHVRYLSLFFTNLRDITVIVLLFSSRQLQSFHLLLGAISTVPFWFWPNMEHVCLSVYSDFLSQFCKLASISMEKCHMVVLCSWYWFQWRWVIRFSCVVDIDFNGEVSYGSLVCFHFSYW